LRVLLDTNVLVSALHFAGATPRRVLDAVLSGQHDMVTGPALLDELEDVLITVCGWEQARAHAARLQVEDLADVVVPRSVPRVCRDADDDEVLAVAQWGRVEMVVTGDKDLLAVGVHAGARMVTPAGFLALAGHEESGPAR
jgi:uncharacterized protein